MDQYIFRREDNEELIEVPYVQMMQMDALGYITLPDGVVARRCRHLEQQKPKPAAEKIVALEKPILSDALGFIEKQLPDFERDRVSNGFRGVEFVRDPEVPQFIQVKISSKREWERYIKHRGLADRNSRNGGNAAPSEQEFDLLREKMLEKYPPKKSLEKSA